MSALSIWDLAAEKVNENSRRRDESVDEDAELASATPTIRDEDREKPDTVAIICGSSNCGKSSLIFQFLDRDEPTKPTVALEYTYGRRTRANNKDVGHIWELGGGPFLSNLLEFPLNEMNVCTTSLVVVLDLSKPETLWHTMETLVYAAKERVENIVAQNVQLAKRLQKRMALKINPDHEDKEMLAVFPIPLAIIGGKYDVFDTELDQKAKRDICKTLRFYAHIHGASLQFFSNKVEALIWRGRALMSHLLFNTMPSKTTVVDPNKPLFVPPGADSFKEIGPPPSDEAGIAGLAAANPLDLWRNAYTAMFPQKNTKLEVLDDPTNDPQFKEEQVDRVRAQKDEELERFRRQKANSSRQAAIIGGLMAGQNTNDEKGQGQPQEED